MPRGTIDDAALEAEIGRLPALGLLELRNRWKTLFGHSAPKSLRRNFLARAVAYQMQVEAYGGLSVGTKRRRCVRRWKTRAYHSGRAAPSSALRYRLSPLLVNQARRSAGSMPRI